MTRYVVAHGGTGSKRSFKDGTDKAVEAGWRAMQMGTPLDAAVAAVAVMEDDERFNCGTGSALRFDGRTIEMDAACMESDRGYGAVCGIQRVKNPILVAKDLVALPNNILCGPAAQAFARRRGYADHDPHTKKAEKQWRHLVDRVRKQKASREESQWDLPTLERSWNYERPFEEVFGSAKGGIVGGAGTGRSDTVGAVVFDGNSFAAAASTGGTISTLCGRIGDTATIGAGIFASEHGAVACSGTGDEILRMRVATMVDNLLRDGKSAHDAVEQVLKEFPADLDLCLTVADKRSYAAGGNRSFAWSAKGEGASGSQRRKSVRPSRRETSSRPTARMGR
ncbi:MAG TPA: isoaspartyl peptidase/L-asparaginase [Candidatus Thermoplasmatota archaeon]|nr:isoaspartyl peptidase/L-asparaginase [Candidatus Thermoplasmatota archaeon]